MRWLQVSSWFCSLRSNIFTLNTEIEIILVTLRIWHKFYTGIPMVTHYHRDRVPEVPTGTHHHRDRAPDKRGY